MNLCRLNKIELTIVRNAEIKPVEINQMSALILFLWNLLKLLSKIENMYEDHFENHKTFLEKQPIMGVN